MGAFWSALHSASHVDETNRALGVSLFIQENRDASLHQEAGAHVILGGNTERVVRGHYLYDALGGTQVAKQQIGYAVVAAAGAAAVAVAVVGFLFVLVPCCCCCC